MEEKILTGIGVLALGIMFYCMMLVVGSDCITDAILPFLAAVVSAATAIYVSNSIEYDDEEE